MTYLLSAGSSFLDQADHFFLPCPFKYLTGYDCPGCGFQRAFLAFLRGNWKESFHLYPPAIFVVLTVIVALFAHRITRGKSDGLVKVLYLITGTVILVSYLVKMFVPHLHSAAALPLHH